MNDDNRPPDSCETMTEIAEVIDGCPHLAHVLPGAALSMIEDPAQAGGWRATKDIDPGAATIIFDDGRALLVARRKTGRSPSLPEAISMAASASSLARELDLRPSTTTLHGDAWPAHMVDAHDDISEVADEILGHGAEIEAMEASGLMTGIDRVVQKTKIRLR